MPQWPHVKAYVDRRVESLSRQLETQGLSLLETEFKRGQLSTLREVLALPDRTEPADPVLFALHTDRR
jgi:hypothetical protein